MARSCKQGVDYFPLDVHMDMKLKFVQVKHGLNGFAIIIKLYQVIYSEGYWVELDDDQKMMFAHENGVTLEELNNIIDTATSKGIFDKTVYDKYSVLTSSGIQKRFKEMVKRRKILEVVDEYTLIDGLMQTSCEHDADMMQTPSKHDANKNGEKKGKEKKVNRKEKETEIETLLASYSDGFRTCFVDFRNHRKQIRAPMTERAEMMLLTELNKISPVEDDQMSMMRQSIVNGWKGVFPPNKQNAGKPNKVDETKENLQRWLDK